MQELSELGIPLEDQFTVKDKAETDTKLDRIITELEYLKNGQNALYDELKKELDELKSLVILGRKTWRQLFVGKMAEWAATDLIAKPLLTKIMEIMGDDYVSLLGS